MRSAAVAVVAVGLLACSTHYTTAKPSEGAVPVYELSDAQALELAHGALAEAFPRRKITPLTGPTWGFHTSYRMLLDTYSQQVLVVPMEGLADDGRKVRGFVFEISGSGSAIISGAVRNRGLFKQVHKLAEATGTRVLIENPTPVSFRPPEGALQERAAERRLRELRDLLDEGLISREQFDAKQKEILDDL